MSLWNWVFCSLFLFGLLKMQDLLTSSLILGGNKGSMTNMTNDLFIYGKNICAFPHILGSPSSYVTLHPIPYEFPYIWGKFCFLFYQCRVSRSDEEGGYFYSYWLACEGCVRPWRRYGVRKGKGVQLYIFRSQQDMQELSSSMKGRGGVPV